MQRDSFRACAVAALALLPTLAQAAVEVERDELEGFFIEVSNGDVTIEGPGLTSGLTFTISCTTVNDAVGKVTVMNTGAANTRISIVIDDSAGFEPRSLLEVIRDDLGEGEVWLDSAVIYGNIGTFNGTNARAGDIIVNRIGSLECGRNIYADIRTLGSAISSERDIGSLTVTGLHREYYSDGNLSANIWATSEFTACGGIGTISVDVGIGAIDGGDMEIECDGDIESIVATGGFSLVDISVPNDKEVWNLVATTGGWGGDGTIAWGITIPQDPEPEPGSPLTEAGSITCGRLRNFSVKKDMQGDITCALAPFSSNTWKIGSRSPAAPASRCPPTA